MMTPMTTTMKRSERRMIDAAPRHAEATKAERVFVFCADCRRVSTSLPTDAVTLPTQETPPPKPTPKPTPTPPSAAAGAPKSNVARNVRSIGEEAEEDEEEEEYKGSNGGDAG